MNQGIKMSGGDIKRDPILSLFMAFPNFPHKDYDIVPGFISFAGAAAINKNKQGEDGKKKEAPISHHVDAPPKLSIHNRFFQLLFLAALPLLRR